MGAIMENLMDMTDMKLSDQVIANSTGVGLKGAASAYLTATLLSVTPEVGHLFSDYLNQTLAANEALTALIIKKNWAQPYASPQEQISMAYKNSEWVLDLRQKQA